jgi:hypothetical protein
VNVRHLGMQVAHDTVSAAWAKTGRPYDSVLVDAMAEAMYAWLCQVKALEFGREYLRSILGQVDQVLGGVQEANFANLPGKAMEMAARMKALEQPIADGIPAPVPPEGFTHGGFVSPSLTVPPLSGHDVRLEPDIESYSARYSHRPKGPA